jgi:hypothetical protein
MSQFTMDLMAKKTGQLNVRIDPSLTGALDEIEQKFRIGQSELVRGLVEAAVQFYKKNGFFAFPVVIEPEASFLQRARQYKSDADLPQVAGKDTEPKQTPKLRKTG